MSAQQNPPRNVIRRDTVRVVPQAAMLDCGDATDSTKGQPIAVVPMLDGDRIAGFEIRCGCGASAIVECVYENPPPDDPPPPEV
ncbi:MAG: hypothetical protein AB8H80_08965 [Planctomycetota bacterium]